MAFEYINHVKINKKTGEPISKNTVKTYKNILNKLSKEGYDTRDKLCRLQSEVISLIDLLIDGDKEADRFLKRQHYSAIFYALDEYPLADKQDYYDAFQKAKQNYGSK